MRRALLPAPRPIPAAPRPARRALLRRALLTPALAGGLAVSLGVVPLGGTPTGVPTGASSASSPVAGTDLVPAAARTDACQERPEPFRPTRLYVPGVVPRSTVLHLGRDARNVPRTTPTTTRGKRQFAWDLKDDIRAGSTLGVVKLNAHTYPDGSAVGNRLLSRLDVGDVIVLEGPNGQSVCYDVVREVQIHKSARYRPYYRTNGEPRLAIMVCSGKRLGPGDWSHRRVWFAAPRIALPFGERWRGQPDGGGRQDGGRDTGGSDWPFWR